MTQFGAKLHAFKASRLTPDSAAPELTFERLRSNQIAGVETNFVADNNLMIQIDGAIDPKRPATDETLAELDLLGWVQFLRECDRRGLAYGFTPFFAYAEMPATLAQARAARFHHFSDKFGLVWHGGEDEEVGGIGRNDMTFEGLDAHQQILMGLSFGALLLMLVINRDGEEFSPIGKFRRYLREYRRLLGTVSLREIAIARYVFATQIECPGPIDEVRSRIEKNFARLKGKKHPVSLSDMQATALNGAFDLHLFHAVNIVDTKGVEGRKLDCWLVTRDEKLKEYNELCHNVDLGTGQAGLFTAIASHEEVSDYWRISGMLLQEIGFEGRQRVLESMRQRMAGTHDKEVALKRLSEIPGKARAVIALAEEGI